jgi:hypothetical protein
MFSHVPSLVEGISILEEVAEIHTVIFFVK